MWARTGAPQQGPPDFVKHRRRGPCQSASHLGGLTRRQVLTRQRLVQQAEPLLDLGRGRSGCEALPVHLCARRAGTPSMRREIRARIRRPSITSDSPQSTFLSLTAESPSNRRISLTTQAASCATVPANAAPNISSTYRSNPVRKSRYVMACAAAPTLSKESTLAMNPKRQQ